MTIKHLLGISAICVAQAVTAQVYNVPSVSGGLGINTASLNNGATYLLEASGTYDFGQGRLADAEWSEVAPIFVEQRGGFPADVLDLAINGAAVDWLGHVGSNWAAHTYSDDHVYRFYVTGTGAPINLTIADWAPLIPGSLHEEDNSGSLKVTISAVPDSMSSLWMLPGMALLFVAARMRKTVAG